MGQNFKQSAALRGEDQLANGNFVLKNIGLGRPEIPVFALFPPLKKGSSGGFRCAQLAKLRGVILSEHKWVILGEC